MECSDTALPVGTALRGGELVIESCLGQGAFRITYRAQDRLLERAVAIKEFFPRDCVRNGKDLRPGGGWTEQHLGDFRNRFIQEGRVLARLRHSGIVQVFNIFEENGTAYLVMEYVVGQTVESYAAARGGRLPAEESVALIRRTGEALEVVHAARLLHRGITPSNVMRRADGEVVLIDFGAAQEYVSDSDHGMSQTMILTHGYAPLEQYDGRCGPYTDVYALSATLYRLLTGVRPVSAIERDTGRALVSPRDLHPDVPTEVSDAVMMGMGLRAEERPQTVAAFLDRLEAASSGQSAPSAPLVTRRQLLLAGGACAVLAGVYGLSRMPGVISDGSLTFIPSDNTGINPKDGAEMVWIPAGEFLMGSSDSDRLASDDEKPQRVVYLDGYWLYRYEVTVGQYRKFCEATGRKMPEAPDWGWKDDHPMVNVSWLDAQAYAKWAGGRLPTEAQWEKGARGTDGRVYPWGDEWDAGKCRCSKEEPGDAKSVSSVGSYRSGSSPYGLQDMSGNVWEWCADWYDENYYRTAPDRNPAGPATGECRVLRGGSWYVNYPNYFRAAYRSRFYPSLRNDVTGFRLAL